VLLVDSDNLLVNFIKDGLVPVTVVLCGSRLLRVVARGGSPEPRRDVAVTPL